METMERTGSNRMVLLLIAGIPVTMILAATWLWYFVVEGDLNLVGTLGTANQGTLVQPPRQLDEGGLLDQGGRVFRYADLEPRWTMLVPVSGSCDADCEQRLYLTRQIHVAIGKDFNRLRRFYVSSSPLAESSLDVSSLSDQRPAPVGLEEFLETEHRGLKPLVLEGETLGRLFPEYLENPSTWYLVDPAGWIMMSYNEQVSYKDVISDLKFLLKNSSG